MFTFNEKGVDIAGNQTRWNNGYICQLLPK